MGKTADLARWHWDRMYSFQNNIEYHRQVASYFIKDDHDTWMNDSYPGMETKYMGEFTWEQGTQIFLDEVPMGEKTYRTIRWGKDLQIWLMEGRDYRSPNPMPGSPSLPILVSRGMLAPLPKEAIPNLKNIDQKFVNLEFNIGMEYGAPYHWGTTGIYMRKPKGTPVEETWGLLFDPNKQPGTFLLLDDMRQTIGMALQYKGHSINTTDPELLSEAADLLIETKQRSLGFEGTVLAANRVLSKEINTSVVFSADAARRMTEDSETVYFIPREGSIMWQDVMSIPARAPHPELAAKFINFILDPQIGARNTNFIKAATPNKAALEYIDPAMLKNPAVYPSADELARLELVKDVGEHTKLFDELWTKIKSK